MPWPAIIAGVVGAAGSIYGAATQASAAEEARKGEQAASREALRIQQQRFEEGRAALQPYAAQEQAASTQMMAQMGLAPPPGAGARGGDVWGFGAPPMGQAPEEIGASRLMEDLITQHMAINARAGMDDDRRNMADSSQAAREQIRQMKASGQLPPDFPELSQEQWGQLAAEQRQAYGGMKRLRRTVPDTGDAPDISTLAAQYGQTAGAGDFQTQQMGPGAMIDPATGLPVARTGMGGDPIPTVGTDFKGVGRAPGEAGAPTGGPAPQTAQDIMRRAGVAGLPQDIQQQYLEDLRGDPRADPELAAYLGLTPESLEVGAAYQETPAYAAAQEAGIEAVQAGAAAGGSLYSGRRGKALRDVGQTVEQQYYADAMRRRQEMMGARRGERREAIGRRGREYGAERSREQSYYNNYMNLLNQLSAPTTTTNIAEMGTSIGKESAANILGTARNVGELQMGEAAYRAGAAGDIAGGIGKVAESYI